MTSNAQVVAQAMHEAACDPAGDACSWSNEDPELTDCRALNGDWRETGLETRILGSMESHGLLAEAIFDIEDKTCTGCGASFDHPSGPGCPMPVQHVMPVRSERLG